MILINQENVHELLSELSGALTEVLNKPVRRSGRLPEIEVKEGKITEDDLQNILHVLMFLVRLRSDAFWDRGYFAEFFWRYPRKNIKFLLFTENQKTSGRGRPAIIKYYLVFDREGVAFTVESRGDLWKILRLEVPDRLPEQLILFSRSREVFTRKFLQVMVDFIPRFSIKMIIEEVIKQIGIKSFTFSL